MHPLHRRTSPRSRLRPARLFLTIAAAAVVLLLPGLLPSALGAPNHPPSVRPPPFNTVGYLSSVDRFPLSYLEWLPTGYSPSVPAPLVVFLHGLGSSTARIVGGVGGNAVPGTVLANASAEGVIVISLNTRTSSGFYANTPCGGPQEQDVLDALAHEKAMRKVSDVFLVGFSMGTVGAFSIAGHHKGLVQGIGVVAPITDLFEQLAFARATRAFPVQYQADLCGRLPSTANLTADRITAYLSVARLAPSNFSGIPIYVTAGAADVLVSNNFSAWPFAQTNSTFVNSSCVFSRAFGEPAGCTTPFWSLVKLHPAAFSFRYVWEGNAPHTPTALEAGDMLEFLEGAVRPAFLSASFPPGPLTVLPAPP